MHVFIMISWLRKSNNLYDTLHVNMFGTSSKFYASFDKLRATYTKSYI